MSHDDLKRAIRGSAPGPIVYRECHRILTDIGTGRLPLLAVRHPLGFVCLPVYRDERAGVCIHVWTPTVRSTPVTTSGVHCHSWDLISFVLYGQVGHTLLKVEPDDEGPDRVFEVHNLEDDDEIVPTERQVRCTEQGRSVTGPGGTYTLAAGLFHANGADAETEAATVLLSNTQDTEDLTIGARHIVGHRVRRQRCSVAETAAIARRVADRLAVTTADQGLWRRP